MSGLSLYERHSVANQTLLFWAAKAKAIEIGRLKSCRAAKDLKFEAGQNVNYYNAKMGKKIATEHFRNFKTAVENSKIRHLPQVSDLIYIAHRGKVRVRFTHEVSSKFKHMKWLEVCSNLSSPDFDILDTLVLRSYRLTNCVLEISLRDITHRQISGDIESIEQFIERLKNSFKLIDHIDNELARTNDNCYDEWTIGLTRMCFDKITSGPAILDSLLESRITTVSASMPATVVSRDTTQDNRSVQQRLDEYISNIIVPRS